MRSISAVTGETPASDRLTENIPDKLSNPATSSELDFQEGVKQVLAGVGMFAADSGGQLTFYGQDPIVPSRIRFATMAGIGLAVDEQVYLPKSPKSYRTVIVPRGWNKPEWLI